MCQKPFFIEFFTKQQYFVCVESRFSIEIKRVCHTPQSKRRLLNLFKYFVYLLRECRMAFR